MIKNRSVRKLKYLDRGKIDIEDPYWVGNKKNWSWYCPEPTCGAPMYPYKQNEYGHIVMACSNPNCIQSGNFPLDVEQRKLMKQMQMNSRKFYRNYLGGYY